MTRFLITPKEMLVLKKAEETIGEPAAQWEGRCYEIASIIADHMRGAQAVYGHYLGYIDPKGYWSSLNVGFIQHGWIIFKNSDFIMDPTRWSFEGKDPYIYYGMVLPDEYDEGGNALRSGNARPCPSFDHKKEVIKFFKATPDSALARHLNCLLPSVRMEQVLMIDVVQAFWLANVHYCRLEPFAQEIYLGLKKAGLMALVPMDNWKRAFRTWG